MTLPYIRPLDPVAPPTVDNTPIMLPSQDAIQLACGERLTMTATAASSSTSVYSLLWLSDGIVSIPDGQARWLAFTQDDTSVTYVANKWTQVGIKFPAGLAAGNYGVIGFAVGDTVGGFNAIAARLNCQGSHYRPAMIAASTMQLPNLRAPCRIASGAFGLLGKFNSNSLPSLDVLFSGSPGTSSKTLTGYMQVVYMGDCNKPNT